MADVNIPFDSYGNKLKYADNGDGTFSQAVADAASLAKLDGILTKLADPATQTTLEAVRVLLNTINSKDFATQTTLAAVLAKLSADPATQTTLAEILAKLISAPATEEKQDTLIAKDFATQTTLAQILAKIISAPSTEANQMSLEAKIDIIDTVLDTLVAKDFATQTTLAQIKSILDTNGIRKIMDPLPVGSNLIGKIDVDSSALPSGAATETTLEAVRAALVAGGLPSSTLETTHHDASTGDGNGTVANVAGYGPIAFQAVGTWDGAKVTYKGSVDGTNYVALPGTSAVTADGIFQPVDPGIAGYKFVRAEITDAVVTTSLTVKSLAVAVAKPTSADVVTVGKDAEGVSVTANPLTIGYKNASGNATGVTPTNALPVQLSGRKAKITISDQTISTQVNSGGTIEFTSILSTPGYIATIDDVYISIPAPVGATSGTHKLYLAVGGTLSRQQLILISTAYNAALSFSLHGPTLGTVDAVFTDSEVRSLIKSGRVKFGELATNKLIIYYINSTDANQTGNRGYYVKSFEEAVV